MGKNLVQKEILKEFTATFGRKYSIYKSSIALKNGNYFFLARDKNKKYLFCLGDSEIAKRFDGETIGTLKFNTNVLTIKRSKLSSQNIKELRNLFPYLSPVFCGLKSSFGSGDRLGIATPAHINAFSDTALFPFLTQQSVRELKKTGRSFQEVIDCASWGVFESGYRGAFGADADHVKEIKDLKSAVNSGFTMFTIDPSDFVLEKANKLNKENISSLFSSIEEKEEIEKEYLGKKIKIGREIIGFDGPSLQHIALLYLDAIKHVVNCHSFLVENIKDKFDFEVSMDEIDSPISPLTHVFIAKELQRKGVNFTSLALRFVGKWQKAVDYIGDLKELSEDIKTHAEIARKLGGYKLSLHSGSEKFSVYKIFSKATEGNYHIKTSGTSWLEALRTIAIKEPGFFYEIYRYALERFEHDKKSYTHSISTETFTIPGIEALPEDKFREVLEIPICRQVLHITFGSILSVTKDGKYIFRDKIYKVLFENEKLHYIYVSENIKKHLKLLKA